MANEKQIQKVLKECISYFGKEKKIYVFECKKCHKLDQITGFVIREQLNLLKLKKSYEMKCLYCSGPSFSIIIFENK